MDYKERYIKELEDTRDKLICMNEKQIDINAKFAKVTEKNNLEYQKTFRCFITIAISAIVLICIGAMLIINYNAHTYSKLKNENNNINFNK